MSLFPLLVVREEVAEEVEGTVRLICWHHVSCFVYQDKPQIVVNLGPPCILAMNSPDLLLSSLPERSVDPVEIIEIV